MNALSALAMEALDRAKRKINRRQACRNKRLWTPAEEQVLRERYADDLTEAIAKDLGRPVSQVLGKANAMGLHKSQEFLAEHCRSIDAETGMAFRFQKGLVPWNKGMKGLQAGGRAKETQFGKGHMPHNWVPVGTEQVRDGYLYRKVTDTRSRHDWKLVHVMLWEEHNGPIPDGFILCFRDGIKSHITIDNLELITRAERMRRNTIHRYPPPLKDAIRAVGKLKRTIRKVEHEEQY